MFVLELVERVFLNIVLAETDDQFSSALNRFLTPLLLKLSTPNEQVKNKVGFIFFVFVFAKIINSLSSLSECISNIFYVTLENTYRYGYAGFE